MLLMSIFFVVVLDICGKKCLFFDVLVWDCFASTIGVHMRNKKKTKFTLSFPFGSSVIDETRQRDQFLEVIMKIKDGSSHIIFYKRKFSHVLDTPEFSPRRTLKNGGFGKKMT